MSNYKTDKISKQVAILAYKNGFRYKNFMNILYGEKDKKKYSPYKLPPQNILQKWFLNEHNIHTWIELLKKEKYYSFHYYINESNYGIIQAFENPEKAFNRGFKFLFENLKTFETNNL